jgi:DNA invertase Pin-like site-specific DNA recombinase
LVIEDRCSGSIPFFERDGGRKIKHLLDKGAIQELAVMSIDRLGRDLRDIINVIYYFTQKGICIYFISQSLRTIDKDGNENSITKMVLSMLAVVSEMEKKQIRERQLQGIQIAKLKGIYLGRKTGSKEDILKFLSKPKNTIALNYLKKGYKNTEVAKLVGININTVTKVKKLGLTSVSK